MDFPSDHPALGRVLPKTPTSEAGNWPRSGSESVSRSQIQVIEVWLWAWKIGAHWLAIHSAIPSNRAADRAISFWSPSRD
jgi:hypothetical protein